jgi:glycosyltransferase involved in cell wall biosynthesis
LREADVDEDRTDLPRDVVDIELSMPLPKTEPRAGRSRARVLARLHSYPLAQADVVVAPDGLAPDELAVAPDGALPAVRQHLRADGVDGPDRVSVEGVGAGDAPACLARRRQLVADGPTLTVLIATRNRAHSLLRCLRSIARLDYPRLDVVIVDNAPSNDETAEAVASLGGRLGAVPVRYVCEPRPGVALARNRGLTEVRGSWVAITDDDVVVDEHWLSGVVEAATSAPGVGCVTGPTVAAEVRTAAQRLRERHGGYAQSFTRHAWNLDSHRPHGDPLFPFAVGRMGAGANMAFDMAVLRRLGGFDQAMGVGTPARGGEDLLAFLQTITAGYTVVYEPAALVWHWHRRDYASLQRQISDYGIGLGAYLTSAVVHEPRLLAGMVRNAVPAARHLLADSSAKNRAKGTGYPRELEAAELIGLVQGPFRYGLSRLQDRWTRW